ncbi:MAG: hypothetical protein ACYCY5_04480 [Sulfuricella sp.]
MSYPIHVEANNPPGKCCTLYIRYAEKIGQHLGTPLSAGFHSPHPVQGRIAPDWPMHRRNCGKPCPLRTRPR